MRRRKERRPREMFAIPVSQGITQYARKLLKILLIILVSSGPYIGEMSAPISIWYLMKCKLDKSLLSGDN